MYSLHIIFLEVCMKKFWFTAPFLALVIALVTVLAGCDNGSTSGAKTPTITFSPKSVTINDNNLSQIVTVGGTATGEITLDTSKLPGAITVTVDSATITVTGQRGSAAIDDTFTVGVTRAGVTQDLTIVADLTAVPVSTVILTPSSVTVSDDNLSQTVEVSGTATGKITLDTSALPGAISAVIDGSTITVTGQRQSAALDDTFIVGVTREGVTQNLTIVADLTADITVPTVILTPSALTVNDSNLSQTVEVSGTATGTVTLNTSALPDELTAAVSETTVTVTGVRPTTDVSAITGTFNVGVTREGVTQNISVTVNLTTTWVKPTVILTPSAVTVNDSNLVQTAEVSGTATGTVTLNTSALPGGVTAAVSGTTVTITGVRPSTNVSAITGTFNVGVTREGTTENISVTVNLTTTYVPVNAVTPVISEQPSDRFYNPGDTVNPLSVTATISDSGQLSYEWFENSVKTTTGGTSVGTGATYTPIISGDVTDDEIAYYWVVVTNTNNSADGNKTASVTSSIATITVTKDTSFDKAETPNITDHLSLQSAVYTRPNTAAVNLTIDATVDDGGQLTYQWFKNSNRLDTAGATPLGTGKSITPVTSDLGIMYYWVVVTNTNNNIVAGATTAVVTETAAVYVKEPDEAVAGYVAIHETSLSWYADPIPLPYFANYFMCSPSFSTLMNEAPTGSFVRIYVSSTEPIGSQIGHVSGYAWEGPDGQYALDVTASGYQQYNDPDGIIFDGYGRWEGAVYGDHDAAVTGITLFIPEDKYEPITMSGICNPKVPFEDMGDLIIPGAVAWVPYSLNGDNNDLIWTPGDPEAVTVLNDPGNSCFVIEAMTPVTTTLTLTSSSDPTIQKTWPLTVYPSATVPSTGYEKTFDHELAIGDYLNAFDADFAAEWASITADGNNDFYVVIEITDNGGRQPSGEVGNADRGLAQFGSGSTGGILYRIYDENQVVLTGKQAIAAFSTNLGTWFSVWGYNAQNIANVQVYTPIAR